jgi:hypothetical protein
MTGCSRLGKLTHLGGKRGFGRIRQRNCRLIKPSEQLVRREIVEDKDILRPYHLDPSAFRPDGVACRNYGDALSKSKLDLIALRVAVSGGLPCQKNRCDLIG